MIWEVRYKQMKYDLMKQVQNCLDTAEGELSVIRNSLPGLITGMNEGTSHDEIAENLIDAINHIRVVRDKLSHFTFGYLNTEVN